MASSGGRLRFAALFVTAVLGAAACAAAEPDFTAQRKAMTAGIALQAQIAEQRHGIPVPGAAILDAMSRVPRHLFVAEGLRPFAYVDRPLPLGFGQNTAQPSIIALMTQLARIGPGDTVFETGTGTGYHAAILSLLARHVVSVEVIAPLAERAAEILARLGYGNVEVHGSDGYFGWPAGGPYDAIIVKEAVNHIPGALADQLKPGGRMVVPLGPLDGPQVLTLIEKDRDGRLRRRPILPVRFSPLQGGQRT